MGSATVAPVYRPGFVLAAPDGTTRPLSRVEAAAYEWLVASDAAMGSGRGGLLERELKAHARLMALVPDHRARGLLLDLVDGCRTRVRHATLEEQYASDTQQGSHQRRGVPHEPSAAGECLAPDCPPVPGGGSDERRGLRAGDPANTREKSGRRRQGTGSPPLGTTSNPGGPEAA